MVFNEPENIKRWERSIQKEAINRVLFIVEELKCCFHPREQHEIHIDCSQVDELETAAKALKIAGHNEEQPGAIAVEV